MWTGHGGWGGWPIQQSAFANIPSEEVDWASLAKQWIAQREVMGMTSQPQQQVPVPAAPPPPPPPPQSTDDDTASDVPADSHELTTAESSTGLGYEGDSGWDGWQNTGWAVSNWTVPPPPPPSDSHEGNVMENRFQSTESYSYGFGHGMNEYYQQQPADNGADGGYPYWSDQRHQQMPGPPMMTSHQLAATSTLEYRPPPRRAFHGGSMHSVVVPGMMDESALDAAKRRQLPAWIREGLEKMEREKQRQLEKEKQIQDAVHAKKLEEQEDSEAVNDNSSEKGLTKSRFDSDDEDDHPSDGETLSRHTRDDDDDDVDSGKMKSSVAAADVFMSEEERQAQMMLQVRQLLTEVLLDVTNREIADVAHTVYVSSKMKQDRAPAKQLAKSSALASITSLGLGYGSGSESNDDADSTSATGRESPAAESSDDEEIEARILRKKMEFESKMRELEERETDGDEDKQKQTDTPSSLARPQQKAGSTERVEFKPDMVHSHEVTSAQPSSDQTPSRLAGNKHDRKHESRTRTEDSDELVEKTVKSMQRKDHKLKTDRPQNVKSMAGKVKKQQKSSESDSDSDSDSDSSTSSDSPSDSQSSDKPSKRRSVKQSQVKEQERHRKSRSSKSKQDSSRETSRTGHDDDDDEVYRKSKQVRHKGQESDVEDREELRTHRGKDDKHRSRRSETDRHDRHRRTTDDDRRQSQTKKRRRSSRSRSRSSDRHARHKAHHHKSSPAAESQQQTSKRQRHHHTSRERSHRSDNRSNSDRSSGKKSRAKRRSSSSSRSSYED